MQILKHPAVKAVRDTQATGMFLVTQQGGEQFVWVCSEMAF